MTQAPAISARTAAAMAADDYLGIPAIDDDMWQGASDASRATVWDNWSICSDDETGRVEAIDADGNRFVANVNRSDEEWGEV